MIALACALALPAVASAETFVVDSTADTADLVLDGSCLTEGGECTLRAAMEEANAEEGFNEIEFSESVFDGQVTGTIDLTDSLPPMTGPTSINGKTCATAAGVSGPCVGVEGLGGKPALIADHAEEVEIWGLAVTGAQTGVRVDGSPRFKAQASWFGVKLDGSPGGNGTGIFVGPESNRSRIGSLGEERRDVFANSTDDGLDVQGARNVEVQGNYFGVGPDGATPAANGGDDVEVTSSGELEATGTLIGARVSAAAAATPECDGGCNVISGAASNGIDLQGDGEPEETPAAVTTILGNFVGLNATGTASVPNASAGVRVGEAAETIVGGSKLGEANRVNGGSVGVLAGPAAADLVVRGNLIGVDVAGSGSLAPPGEGISVESEEFPTPALEAAIVDNEIRGGGVAIAQKGFGATIAQNEISGAGIGIKTYGPTAEHGNLIEGNSIEGLGANGIVVENDLNEIVGNEILGAGEAGIWIDGAPLFFGVSENLVGGNEAVEENAIVGSGGAAIEISNPKNTVNEVARNRGIANGGLFIELVAAPGAEKGPNQGIEPPILSSLTQAGAGGSAEAGARVRVFRKQVASPGELDSFLGEAIADAEGNWALDFGGGVQAGTIVAVTQTSLAGGTSELTPAATVPGGESPAPEGGGGVPGGEGGEGGEAAAGIAGNAGSSAAENRPKARIRPQTKIVKAPRRRSRSRTARFGFRSSEEGSVFLCRLDERPFDLCGSPKRYEQLKPGRHVFEVRAIDPDGHADPSPAKSDFTVLG